MLRTNLASGVVLAAHADWSVDARKRWITRALATGAAWRIAAPAPVGEVGTLIQRLRMQAGDGAAVLGVDLPLGVPRSYARLHPRFDGFRAFLRGLPDWPAFFQVCASLDEISPYRPFYPARGRAGMTRAAHAAALGFDSFTALSRVCDRATAERPAGASLFWTLGANQSGKAALSAWRDMLLAPGPSAVGQECADQPPLLLWPFDGMLRDLISPGHVIVAETYPAEALRHLGLRLAGSKRRQGDRARLAGGIHAALAALQAFPDADLVAMIDDGFGADTAGEDRFDSVLGTLCVLNVLTGGRPDFVPDDPWIRRWEGWVLGQTSMPRALAENPVSDDRAR